jgi:pentatricopeptide repeat protein
MIVTCCSLCVAATPTVVLVVALAVLTVTVPRCYSKQLFEAFPTVLMLLLLSLTYTYTHTQCLQHNRWQQALDLVHTMECNDVAPDVSTYTAAMTCCNNAKKWQYALQLWEAMKQRVRTTPINSGSSASRTTTSSSSSSSRSSSSSNSYDGISNSSGGSLKFRPRPCVPVVPNVQAYGACIQVSFAVLHTACMLPICEFSFCSLL